MSKHLVYISFSDISLALNCAGLMWLCICFIAFTSCCLVAVCSFRVFVQLLCHSSNIFSIYMET